MKVYLYDEDTKELTGMTEVGLDPVRSEREGRAVYAFPPCCTNLIPEAPKEHEIAIYNESDKCWEYHEDYRGTVVFNKKTGEPLTVPEIGPLPEGYVLERPVFLKEEKAKKLKEIQELFDILKVGKFQHNNFNETLEFRFKIKSMMVGMKKEEYEIMENSKGEAVKASKEVLEDLYKFYTYVDRLLIIKKANAVKAINKCKSLSSLEKIKIDVNIEKEAETLMKMTKEEVEEYFKNNTTGE